MVQSNWSFGEDDSSLYTLEHLVRHDRFGTCPSKTQSPLPSAPMDRGIHSSPSPSACCVPVSQAPLLSLRKYTYIRHGK